MLNGGIVAEVTAFASGPVTIGPLTLVIGLQLQERNWVVGPGASDHRRAAYEDLDELETTKASTELQRLLNRGNLLRLLCFDQLL